MEYFQEIKRPCVSLNNIAWFFVCIPIAGNHQSTSYLQEVIH